MAESFPEFPAGYKIAVELPGDGQWIVLWSESCFVPRPEWDEEGQSLTLRITGGRHIVHEGEILECPHCGAIDDEVGGGLSGPQWVCRACRKTYKTLDAKTKRFEELKPGREARLIERFGPECGAVAFQRLQSLKTSGE